MTISSFPTRRPSFFWLRFNAEVISTLSLRCSDIAYRFGFGAQGNADLYCSAVGMRERFAAFLTADFRIAMVGSSSKAAINSFTPNNWNLKASFVVLIYSPSRISG